MSRDWFSIAAVETLIKGLDDWVPVVSIGYLYPLWGVNLTPRRMRLLLWRLDALGLMVPGSIEQFVKDSWRPLGATFADRQQEIDRLFAAFFDGTWDSVGFAIWLKNTELGDQMAAKALRLRDAREGG